MSNSRIFQASYPAERMRGCKFATDFRDPLVMARDGWTAFGAPLYHPDGGAILNGTTQYFTRPLAGELNSASLTIHMEFYPSYNYTDNAYHYLFDSTGRIYARKTDTAASNVLEIKMNGTTIASVAAATYGPLWVTGGRNLLSISANAAGANLVFFNGVQVASSATAWVQGNSAVLAIGTSITLGALLAGGTYKRLLIGHHTSTLAEHLAYWNRTMWNWEDRCNINLMFRMADYNPTAYLTKDSSGHGVDFTLGNGAGASEPVQGDGRMVFAGAEYLQRASVAQPTGAFTVAGTIKADRNTTAEWVMGHGPAAACNWLLANVSGQWSFYVGGLAGGNRAYMPVAINRINTHTYVGVWTGTATQLYVDGVYQTPAIIPLAPSFGAQNMTLGKSTNAASGYFDGTIFDFKYRDGEAWNAVQAADYHQRMMSTLGAEI